MKQATMLYKWPGPHEMHGDKFDYVIVDAAEHGAIDDAIKAGWRLTTTEALAYDDDPDDDGKPTRAELEQQATELGLKFDGRTSDAKLARMINEALEQ